MNCMLVIYELKINYTREMRKSARIWQAILLFNSIKEILSNVKILNNNFKKELRFLLMNQNYVMT